MIDRFPPNDIISLLDVDLEHNLAESTSEDLILGDLLDEPLLEALRRLRLGYGSSRGSAEVRRAVAGKLGVSPQDVLITNGAVAGLFMATFCLCGPGDEVVVTEPGFPATLGGIAAVGAVKRPLRLSFDEGYELDLDRFAGLLGDKTRLVVLTSPQNPSGVSVEPSEIGAVLDLLEARAPQAYLLVDETYREATYGGRSPQPSVAGLSPRLLTTASLSKCHGAPGLRMGWLSCRDVPLMRQLVRAKLNTVISCSVVDEAIGLRVLERGGELLAERSGALARAVAQVGAWVERNGGLVEWVEPDAGALCCVRLRPEAFGDADVERFYGSTARHGVQIADGAWFHEERRVFRLGFGHLPLARLGPALDALSGVLEEAVVA